jgi:hypothetical protein
VGVDKGCANGPGRTQRLRAIAGFGLIGLLLLTLAVAVGQAPSAVASSKGLKGSSCKHPYTVFMDERHRSPTVGRIVGDLYYGHLKIHAIDPNNFSRPARAQFSWSGKHGSIVCSFLVAHGSTVLLNRKGPRGGTNVQVQFPKGGGRDTVILKTARSTNGTKASVASSKGLKGSSCQHPYKVYLDIGHRSPTVGRFIGDTYYGHIGDHAIDPNNFSLPSRALFSWNGKHGTIVCTFSVIRGTTVVLKRKGPRGGKNVKVQFPRSNARDHIVLTTARRPSGTKASVASSKGLKGSSCKHPYIIFLDQGRRSPTVGHIIGDTYYGRIKAHGLDINNFSRPPRALFSWNAKHGTIVCSFLVKKGSTVLINRKGPRGGTNVKVQFPEGGGRLYNILKTARRA